MSGPDDAGRKWLRRALMVFPLAAAAAVGGWLLVPSRPLAGAAVVAAASSTTIPPPAQGPPATTPPLSPRRGAVAGAPPETNPDAPRGAGGLTGQVLYEQYCASCHGEDGQGSARSEGVSLHGVGEAAVDFELTTGRMPRKATQGDHGSAPYKAILPGADIKALDYYIATYISKGGPPIPAVDPAAGNEAQGGELFRQDCAACHSWAGAGGVLYTRYVPRITYATPTQVGEALRIGPDQMPRFGPNELSQKQLDDIAAFVTHVLEHEDDKGGDALSHIGPIAEGFVVLGIVLPLLVFFMRWIGQRG